jgi:hypothetical protein
VSELPEKDISNVLVHIFRFNIHILLYCPGLDNRKWRSQEKEKQKEKTRKRGQGNSIY